MRQCYSGETKLRSARHMGTRVSESAPAEERAKYVIKYVVRFSMLVQHAELARGANGKRMTG